MLGLQHSQQLDDPSHRSRPIDKPNAMVLETVACIQPTVARLLLLWVR